MEIKIARQIIKRVPNSTIIKKPTTKGWEPVIMVGKDFTEEPVMEAS